MGRSGRSSLTAAQRAPSKLAHDGPEALAPSALTEVSDVDRNEQAHDGECDEQHVFRFARGLAAVQFLDPHFWVSATVQ